MTVVQTFDLRPVLRKSGDPMNGLAPMIAIANENPDVVVVVHPSKLERLAAVMVTLGGRFDVRIRSSPECSPAAFYLMPATLFPGDWPT